MSKTEIHLTGDPCTKDTIQTITEHLSAEKVVTITLNPATTSIVGSAFSIPTKMIITDVSGKTVFEDGNKQKE